MVDRVGASYRVLLYQPSIRFILITNSKVLSLQHCCLSITLRYSTLTTNTVSCTASLSLSLSPFSNTLTTTSGKFTQFLLEQVKSMHGDILGSTSGLHEH